jgi:hypothetical protein
MAKPTSNKRRFFNEEEKEYLKRFLETPKGQSHPPALVKEFCKKFDRDLRSIIQYTTRMRRNNAIGTESIAPVKKEKVKPVVTDFTAIKRNEFIIPVTNWELRTENGQTNLILKFK